MSGPQHTSVFVSKGLGTLLVPSFSELGERTRHLSPRCEDHNFQWAEDPLAGLGLDQSSGLNGRSSAAQVPDLLGADSAASSSKSWPQTEVYSKHSVTVSFAFSKASSQPALTDIQASYTTTSSSPITKFSLQVCPVLSDLA